MVPLLSKPIKSLMSFLCDRQLCSRNRQSARKWGRLGAARKEPGKKLGKKQRAEGVTAMTALEVVGTPYTGSLAPGDGRLAGCDLVAKTSQMWINFQRCA